MTKHQEHVLCVLRQGGYAWHSRYMHNANGACYLVHAGSLHQERVLLKTVSALVDAGLAYASQPEGTDWEYRATPNRSTP